MQIYRYLMALFMLVALTTSSHAVSIKLDGSGGLTSGTDGITTNTAASSGVSTTTISLTIPSTAKSGNSFVRVRFSEGNSADEKNPSSDLSLRGEIEDYQVSIANEGSISGNVKDSLSNNLSGIIIKLMSGTAEVANTTTDANGHYTFSSVAMGDYTIIDTATNTISISDEDTSDDGDTVANSNLTDKAIPVSITAGEADNDNNFIQTMPGSISGNVNNPASEGIAGATVSIMTTGTGATIVNDINGNPLTTTTDASGHYSFINIPLGSYTITQTDKAGYTSVSDVDGGNPNEIAITVSASENDNDNIFIDKRTSGVVSGSVTDIQGNALANISLTIQDSSGNMINDIEGNPLTTTTDVSGFYSFSNVPEGDYIIVESDTVGYVSTSDTASIDNDNTPNTDTNDNKIPFSIIGNEQDTDNNFVDEGVKSIKSISGKVLVDIDGDAIEDKGLENVTVKISSCATNTFSSTTTDANGVFHFNNLIAGCYTITEIDPQGYNSVKDSDENNDNNITVALGESNVINIFFLDEPSLTISGNVKADTDFDDVVDVPLENVTIKLSTFDGALLETVQTDANGNYTFTQVTPSTYTIIETDLEGYSSLRDIDGDNENLIMITLSEQDITGQNFEDQKRITVSGVVKVDIDGDNIVDEPLKNSTLVICKVVDPCTADSNIKKVVTDEDGVYQFDDLEPGDYKIIEIDKEGYESIGDVDGANDNTININLTGNGDVTNQDFDNQAVAPRFIVLTKSVSKKQASIGDFVPYSISVENVNNSYNYAALSIRDVLPAGFKYEKGSARLIRGTSKTAINTTGTDIVEFGTFNLNAHETVTISYLLKVGVSVAKGEHINSATANQNGEDVSNTSRASVTIIADPFTDNSVVIGKVFEDKNENGIQDKGEKGIPGVRIASVTGMLIETDGYGRYHVADAKSSDFGGRGANFILKVDPATLPAGARFTTENPRVHRVTASGLNVIDFGVKLPEVERFSKERIITKVKMQKQQVEVEKSIKIGSIFFDSDQDCIRPNQVQSICNIANKLKKYQGGSIMIEGNTDARAPIWYNKKLAYKRAQSVYKELRHQLGDAMMGKVEVIYDNCEKEVSFDPRYDWWGKPNIPRSKKECTQFGISKKRCNTLLDANKGGAL